MAASITLLSSGQSTTATTTVSFAAQSSGDVLVLTVGSDDYRTTSGASRPESTGFAIPTGCGQEGNLGHYIWTKVSAGSETSVQYTIGSASYSTYQLYVITGLDTSGSPVDVSNGQIVTSFGSSYTAPAVTPTTGPRFAFASIGGSTSGRDVTGMGSWTNSYTESGDTRTAPPGGTQDAVACATLALTGNGSTTTSTGATYEGTGGVTCRTGMIVVFKVATGGATNATPTPSTVAAVAAVPAPSISTPSSATVVGVVVAALAAVAAPTLVAGSSTTVTPAAVAAVASVDAMQGATGVSMDAITVAAVAAIGAPTVSSGASVNVTAAAVAAVAAVAAPTVTADSNASVSPIVVAAVTTVESPAVQSGANATASTTAVDLVAGVGIVTVVAVSNATVNPAEVPAVASVGVPSIAAASTATVAPAAVAAVALVGAPTATTRTVDLRVGAIVEHFRTVTITERQRTVTIEENSA